MGSSKIGPFKVILSASDSVSWLLFLLCQSGSQCCALKLSEQLVRLSSKLICLRATFSCPFTPFPSFINLIAHSLISLRLSPSLVLWPIPEGSIVKVSQPISVQLMYCPLPDTTSIVSHGTSPAYSRAAGQREAGCCFGEGQMVVDQTVQMRPRDVNHSITRSISL